MLVNWNVEYDLAKGLIRLFRDTDCSNQFLAYWVAQSQQPYTVTNIEKVTPQTPHAVGHAYINGEKIRVTFDTGASQSVLSLKAAARAGVKLDSPGVDEAGISRSIGRNMVKSYIAPFAASSLPMAKRSRMRVCNRRHQP